MLGIVSSHQRQGFGKALVAATKELARCSADSRGILLNTETEKNIPYYEKLGFRVVGEADADHVHTWSMFWSCE
jgi:GNAT superfamily N-acetyltransferase